MSFLPKGYSAPKTSGSYMKFEEGMNKFRIVTDAVTGFEYWDTNNKPKRLREMPREIPKDIRGDSAIKHFWAFGVINRWNNQIQILEITQAGIMRDVTALFENPDWGDPKGYDLNIQRTGKGLETKYTTQPSPHKALTPEEQKLIQETKINLENLFYGEDPFGNFVPPAEEEKIPLPEEEINTNDIPF
jgi:hypothetical protein